MYKKIITACLALVALAAFALPASAMAENRPTLTENGASVPVGASIVGTNIEETLFVATNGETVQVRCKTAKLTGTVTANSGGTVRGEIKTFDFSGTGAVAADNGLTECTGSFGNAWITVPTNPLILESTTGFGEDEFRVSAKGGGNVRFIVGSTTAGECEYEGTSTLRGDYTTETTTKLTVRNTQEGSGSKLIRGGFLCPTSGQLKMKFFLETTDGTELGISKAP
jgi:hypothetical protein